VTIAEAKTNPPTEEEARELAAFRDWIGRRLDLSTLDPVLGPQTPVRLMLAESTRPEPIPEYIEVESFLERYLRPGPVKKHPPSRPYGSRLDTFAAPNPDINIGAEAPLSINPEHSPGVAVLVRE